MIFRVCVREFENDKTDPKYESDAKMMHIGDKGQRWTHYAIKETRKLLKKMPP